MDLLASCLQAPLFALAQDLSLAVGACLFAAVSSLFCALSCFLCARLMLSQGRVRSHDEPQREPATTRAEPRPQRQPRAPRPPLFDSIERTELLSLRTELVDRKALMNMPLHARNG